MSNTTTASTVLRLDVRLTCLMWRFLANAIVLSGIQKVPIQWEHAPPYIREKYLDRHPEYRNYTTGAGSLHTDKINPDQVLNFILGVSERTCHEWVAQNTLGNFFVQLKIFLAIIPKIWCFAVTLPSVLASNLKTKLKWHCVLQTLSAPSCKSPTQPKFTLANASLTSHWRKIKWLERHSR